MSEQSASTSGDPVNTPAEAHYDVAPHPEKPKPGDPDFVPPTVIIEPMDEPVEEGPTPEQIDVDKHKALAVAGYILFLIPLIAAPKSKFARYHANQSLLLLITGVCVMACLAILKQILEVLEKYTAFGGFNPISVILFLIIVAAIVISLAWFLMGVQGVVNAANGEENPLPVIGTRTLIK
jgi:uncharacterized membrane protein